VTSNSKTRDGFPRILIQSPPGFTLFELIVVLIILSLSIGIMLPRVGAGWRRMGDRQFVQEFVQTLKRARLRAMNSGEIVAFRIRDSERLYDIELPLQKVIPFNVDIFAYHLEEDPETRDHVILFYPDGSLVGSDLEIVFDHHRTYGISINPIFGTVRWAEVKPR
jgi:prepilin-type N-terminal cleavage/methylation domain-containing protein